MECEIPKYQPNSDEIRAVLTSAKNIAVVGLSPKPERPSHRIALYLMEQGYNVIGVNPGMSTFEGKKVYKSLSEVPDPIDIVDIFRQPEEVPAIVEEAIQKKAKFIWMQQGIVNNAAAERAQQAGLGVVMNRCISVEHMGL